MPKKKMTDQVRLRISPVSHKRLKRQAKELGMTVTGMIRLALKQVFGIEI